jgi:hypothetical protein
MLASSAAGAVIALSHYLGALLNGLLCSIFSSERSSAPSQAIPAETGLKKSSLLDLFTDSMMAAFRSLGIICGYIVLFMMITDFIELAGVLEYIRTDYSRGLVKGIWK